MLPMSFLLALTVATTALAANPIAPETKCYRAVSNLPTPASCDVALDNLQNFLLPYFRQETVKVGASRTSDIKLYKAFADDRPGLPPRTLRCSIIVSWDPDFPAAQKPAPVSPNAWDVLYPNQLLSAAQRIRDKCIAGRPPQYGSERIVPHKWINLNIEGFTHDPTSGNWTMLASNGTEIAVDASSVNPVAASASSSSTVSGTSPGLGSVQTS
ncbi:hypothetical protein N7G274_004148 [Stereocaulon virgatum]|uniref:Uncharacterized protein n=1 Tax=Stereocaulon virgatum TaxID=373712 RepID=A0ABR4AI43_9LECA